MPNARSKNKAEIGGYFDCELVADVARASKLMGVTVTAFAVEAYTEGLRRDPFHRPDMRHRKRRPLPTPH